MTSVKEPDIIPGTAGTKLQRMDVRGHALNAEDWITSETLARGWLGHQTIMPGTKEDRHVEGHL